MAVWETGGERKRPGREQLQEMMPAGPAWGSGAEWEAGGPVCAAELRPRIPASACVLRPSIVQSLLHRVREGGGLAPCPLSFSRQIGCVEAGEEVRLLGGERQENPGWGSRREDRWWGEREKWREGRTGPRGRGLRERLSL